MGKCPFPEQVAVINLLGKEKGKKMKLIF